MPKVPKKSTGKSEPAGSGQTNRDPPTSEAETSSRPKLVFHCQQAQGSPTGVISGFTNVKELYQKIAECYDLKSSEVCAKSLGSSVVLS